MNCSFTVVSAIAECWHIKFQHVKFTVHGATPSVCIRESEYEQSHVGCETVKQNLFLPVSQIFQRCKKQCIPWICYERSFNEFCLFIWNQLVFNKRLQLFVQSPQPYLLIFAWRNEMCLPNILVKKTNEYLNSAEQIPRNWNVDQLSVLITSWDIT